LGFLRNNGNQGNQRTLRREKIVRAFSLQKN
jgi:hypothetical protein